MLAESSNVVRQPSPNGPLALVWVRFQPEAIADPDVRARVKRRHRLGKLMEVNGIDHLLSAPFETQAEAGDAAMRLVDEAEAPALPVTRIADRFGLEQGRITAVASEGIGEAPLELVQRLGARPQWQAPSRSAHEAAQIVDAMAMVGMVVRDDARIE